MTRPLARAHINSRTALLLVLALLWQSLWPMLTLATAPQVATAEATETSTHCADRQMPVADDCCADHAHAAPCCGEGLRCFGECSPLRLVIALPSMVPSLSPMLTMTPRADRRPIVVALHPVTPPLRPPISA